MSPKPSVLRFLNSDMINTHSDLRFEMSNLNYPGIYVHVAFNSHFGSLWYHGGLQMTSRSLLTSNLSLVASITHIQCFFCLILLL